VGIKERLAPDVSAALTQPDQSARDGENQLPPVWLWLLVAGLRQVLFAPLASSYMPEYYLDSFPKLWAIDLVATTVAAPGSPCRLRHRGKLLRCLLPLSFLVGLGEEHHLRVRRYAATWG
jgi:hypothetical protein